jgi:adenylosuccinate synthase
LSGVDTIAVMLLDVLSGLDELKICTAYEIDGKTSNRFPSHVDDLRRAKPVYETVPGWKEEITTCKSYDALPQNARDYLRRIGELVKQPIGMVSVGPERDQTIVVSKS